MTYFTLEHIALGIAMASPAAAAKLLDSLDQMSWHDEEVAHMLAGIKARDPAPMRAWLAKHKLAKGQPIDSIFRELITYGTAKRKREIAQALVDAAKLMGPTEFLKEWDKQFKGV